MPPGMPLHLRKIADAFSQIPGDGETNESVGSGRVTGKSKADPPPAFSGDRSGASPGQLHEQICLSLTGFDPPLRGGESFNGPYPTVPSAAADSTVGYFRMLPPGAGPKPIFLSDRKNQLRQRFLFMQLP